MSRQLFRIERFPPRCFCHVTRMSHEAAEMGFLQRIHGVTLSDRMFKYQILKTLTFEPLPFQIERFQIRRFGHFSRMSQERIALQFLLDKSKKKRPGIYQRHGVVITFPTWVGFILVPSQLSENTENRYNVMTAAPRPLEYGWEATVPWSHPQTLKI